MDKKSVLDEIFSSDPTGLLDVKPKISFTRTEDERLIASFEEINAFFDKQKREPGESHDMQERTLSARLCSLRQNVSKLNFLKPYDKFDLLKSQPPKEINTIDDFFEDDTFGLFEDETEGLFDFKHVDYSDERASADFVAKRKPCKDFDQFEALLQSVQKDLTMGKRRLVPFNQDNLRAGAFYVHNGVLFYLKEINITQKEHYKSDGTRVREDGRTRCIFENGTESNMLKRSVEKILYANGRVVTENSDFVAENLFSSQVSEPDIETGFIYIGQTLSENPDIKDLNHLYKIGFTNVSVKERIANAKNEPTYLMADFSLIRTFSCYNLNPLKLEQIVQSFFSEVCLNIDIFDNKGLRHTPREWFIVPLPMIEKCIDLVLSNQITNFRYDSNLQEIFKK